METDMLLVKDLEVVTRDLKDRHAATDEALPVLDCVCARFLATEPIVPSAA